ncbi:hypothetical protein K443DRAFT_100688 [Laccaria amethystina LaAM-08-1]|uniref:Major facilitator superfamily (MFS) profile domain-containing protein n=1 Tax=Laccaria amethystina LaAM-08-1 TaxID=1095629 RepID=A0A0C9XWH7_9AGAR|nr:hypothetical protein K443DRAFT_100688 [Laccaria amethystina LaAM-08-1]
MDSSNAGQLERTPSEKADVKSDSSLRLPTPPARSAFKSVLLVLTMTLGMIVNTSGSTSITIALPTIGKEFHLQENELQWLVSAYPLSSGCLLLVFGRVADLYGRKKVFLCGSLFLAVFTLACSFQHDVISLDIIRGIQGIGSAALVPASLGILADAFPPSRARSLAFATFSAGAPLGGVVGTIVGGILTQYTAHVLFLAKTWRAPFYLLTGLTVLCFVGGLMSIDPDVPSCEPDKRIDWLGALSVTAGLVLIVFVLSQGELAPKKWATPYIIALLILGVLLLILFVLWQQYLEKVQNDPNAVHSVLTPPPLIQPSLWKRGEGKLAAMMIIGFVNWASFLAWIVWVQLYYQNYLQLSVIQSVVRFLPMVVSGLLCNTFVGIMAARVPVICLTAIGTGATAGACLLFALINPHASYWAFAFPASVISVMGADFVFSTGTLFIAKVVRSYEQSVAGALFLTMNQLGTALGVATTTVVFNRVDLHRHGRDGIVSYKAAQWACFSFGVLGTLLSLLFFRGVGAAGVREPIDKPETPNANEERSMTYSNQDIKSEK